MLRRGIHSRLARKAGLGCLVIALCLSLPSLAQEKDKATKPDKAPSKAPADKGEKAKAPAPELTNSIGMKLRWIAPGKFVMAKFAALGAKGGLSGGIEVEISRGCYLGVHEVTQGDYTRLMGKNPSSFSAGGDNRHRVADLDTKRFPVENVSWTDATAFCARLSALPEEKSAGRVYRLPTEAEWEYAARSGDRKLQPFTNGLSLSGKDANFNGHFPDGTGAKGSYLQRTAAVGSYKPNAWGLYDLHGNVWEWCADWYGTDGPTASKDPAGPKTGSRRVLRGGSWLNRGQDCRLNDRLGIDPAERYNNVGFRVVAVVAGGG